MYDSYEEAYKTYHDELVDSLWKLDDEYKNKNAVIIDKINYLEEYKEKRNEPVGINQQNKEYEV